MKRLAIISPPFYSHFKPLITLGCLLKDKYEITVACSTAFKSHILEAGLRFYLLEITRNANVGVLNSTNQPQSEKNRLNAFIQATKNGPVATLLYQSKNRKKDMLTDPIRIRNEIIEFQQKEGIDVFIVDQLSYSVTLALYCLEFPFITYVPGHPTYIPFGKHKFGEPYNWPKAFNINPALLKTLNETVSQTEKEFTLQFNEIIENYSSRIKPINSAFKLSSKHFILFNYPNLGTLHQELKVDHFYLGSCFQEQGLSDNWLNLLKRFKNNYPKIMISFGTFLASREDVLDKIFHILLEMFPNCLLISASGSSHEILTKKYGNNNNLVLKEFIPQIGLYPEVDLVIHHGGNNTFTETLFYGKPMIILPFSSDQFSIGYDVENNQLGRCLDPNNFSKEDLAYSVKYILTKSFQKNLLSWSKEIRQLRKIITEKLDFSGICT